MGVRSLIISNVGWTTALLLALLPAATVDAEEFTSDEFLDRYAFIMAGLRIDEKCHFINNNVRAELDGSLPDIRRIAGARIDTATQSKLEDGLRFLASISSCNSADQEMMPQVVETVGVVCKALQLSNCREGGDQLNPSNRPIR